MPLAMTRPTKHPKTGVFRIRKGIPPALRDAAHRLYGQRWELIESLGTKNEREARERAPAVLAEIERKLEVCRRRTTEPPRRLSHMECVAIAGAWRKERLEANEQNPGPPGGWEAERDRLLDDVATEPGEPATDYRPRPRDIAEAEAVAAVHGITADQASLSALAQALWLAKVHIAETMVRRASGDYGRDEYANRYPDITAAVAQRTTSSDCDASLAFDDLLNGWARDHGLDPHGQPIERALYDRKRTLERLAAFVGHRNAAAVGKSDAARWKEGMQIRRLSNSTIRNDISEMSAIWNWAIRNGKLKDNPFAGVAPPKERSPKRKRRGFTDAEAAAILTASRELTGYMRWLPWVCCFTGARISEICQASKADIVEINGIPVLRVTNEGDDEASSAARSVKNEYSRRDVPLHPALVAEGFLDYVRDLPVGSPLFPDAAPDRVFGRRSTTAGRKISRWLKADLGITDQKISPNHSWRHFFISACRSVAMNPEIRSALTGHSAKIDESADYGDEMKTFVGLLAANIAKLKSPVTPLGWLRSDGELASTLTER